MESLSSSVPRYKPDLTLGLITVAIAAIFYCYEYLLRVAPSVMYTELMHHYQINDFQLSTLTAYYYYIYAPMQLPVGLLVDRYGSKRLLVGACLSCALGAYFFVCSHFLIVAKVGRFLVGLGSAFAFVGVLKLATQYLPRSYFAVISGITMALGQLGAVLGDVVLTKIMQNKDWQQASVDAAFFGLLLTLALLTVFYACNKQDRQQVATDTPSTQEVVQHFRHLLANINLWKISLIGALLWVPIVVFAEYLGIDFLKRAYALSSEQAAIANAMIFVGMATGGPVVTSVSNYLCSRIKPIIFGTLISTCCLISILYHTTTPYPFLHLLLFLLGLSTSTQVLVFPMAEEIACQQSSGTALALTNMMVMFSGIIFQPLTGFLLSLTTYTIADAQSIYGYQLALAYMPLVTASSIIVALWTKETYQASQSTYRIDDHAAQVA